MKKYLCLLVVLIVVGCGLNNIETEETTLIANEIFTKRTHAQKFIGEQERMMRIQATQVMHSNFSPMWINEFNTQSVVKETMIAVIAAPLAVIKQLSYNLQILEAPVFFPYNSYRLSGVARSVIQTKADIMNTDDRLVLTIIGKASDTGDAVYNKKLSRLRAGMCKQYLIAQNVKPNRLLITYRGMVDSVGPLNEDQRANFKVNIVPEGQSIELPPEGVGIHAYGTK